MIVEHAIVPGSTKRLSIDECRPALQDLHALWQKLRGDRRMPARRDWNASQLEQEEISRNSLLEGSQTSKSYVFADANPISPVESNMVR